MCFVAGFRDIKHSAESKDERSFPQAAAVFVATERGSAHDQSSAGQCKQRQCNSPEPPRMTEAVSPAALEPLPDVYTAMGAAS